MHLRSSSIKSTGVKVLQMVSVLESTKKRLRRALIHFSFESLLGHAHILSANVSIIPLGKENQQLGDSEDEDMQDLRMVMGQSELKGNQMSHKEGSGESKRILGAACFWRLLRRKVLGQTKWSFKRIKSIERRPRNLMKQFCRAGYSPLGYQAIRGVTILGSVLNGRVCSGLRAGFRRVRLTAKKGESEEIVMFESFGDPNYLASIKNQVANVSEKKEKKKKGAKRLVSFLSQQSLKEKLIGFFTILRASQMKKTQSSFEKRKGFLLISKFSCVQRVLFQLKGWGFRNLKATNEKKPLKKPKKTEPETEENQVPKKYFIFVN